MIGSVRMARQRHVFRHRSQKTRDNIQSIPMRRGDYGYEAPYALIMFGLLAVGSGIGAAIAWRNEPIRAALPITFYFVFFLANTSSFFYTTRRGKFLEWDRILDRLRLRGDEEVL